MDFTLRPWKTTDLNSLVKYANNFQIAKNLADQFPHPYTMEKAKLYIEAATKDVPYNRLAIEINGEAVGGIGVHPKSDIECKNAELGYWLGEPFWGNGIITQAIIQIVDYGFKNFDIDRIFARPFGANVPSQRVLEKAGFMLEGKYEKTFFKNGEYQDELVYAVRRENKM